MPGAQWSFIFRSYTGAFDPGATRLLQQVDPAVVDNTTMTDGERRLSVQLFYVLALTCRGKSLQVVRRVPEGFGFEAWKQLCKEIEPRLRSRFQGILQPILSTATTDDPVQAIYQWESRVKVYEEQSGDNVAENINLAVLQKYLCDGELARHLNLQSVRLTTYELARKEAINNLRAKQTWMATGITCHRSGRGRVARKAAKGVLLLGKQGHSKSECRNLR